MRRDLQAPSRRIRRLPAELRRTAKRWMLASVWTLLGGALSAAEAPAPVSATKLIGDLKQLLPNSTAVLMDQAAALPGEYQTRSIGYRETYYVFSDGTYATVLVFDVGADFDEGKWIFAGGVLSLVSDDPMSQGARKTKSLVPLTLTTRDKTERVLVSPQEVAYWLDAERRGFAVLDYAVRTRDFDPKEVVALKDELDLSYGKYSMYGLWSRLHAQCAVGSKTTDGAWILSGKRPNQPGALGLSDASGDPLTEIFGMEGNADGLAEITIGGVKLRARQIEISRKFEAVHLTGSVEIVGGKLPPAPGLEIWIEGKKVSP